jgi:hypothetical protein
MEISSGCGAWFNKIAAAAAAGNVELMAEIKTACGRLFFLYYLGEKFPFAVHHCDYMVFSEPGQLILNIYTRVHFNGESVNHCRALFFRLEIDKLEKIFRRYFVCVFICEIGNDINGCNRTGRQKIHQIIRKRIIHNEIVSGHDVSLIILSKRDQRSYPENITDVNAFTLKKGRLLYTSFKGLLGCNFTGFSDKDFRRTTPSRDRLFVSA